MRYLARVSAKDTGLDFIHEIMDYYIDLAKPKSGARIFFPRTSQGHNALPRPGLEPGSSDSEPSALTTGLLDKAVALACRRYS